MIRNILLHMDTGDRRKARLDLAVLLARRHDARLTALFPLDVPRFPSFVETPIDIRVFERHLERLKERADMIAGEFREGARRQGVAAEWRREEGDAIALMVEHARYADIAVLPQEWATYGRSDGFLPGEVALAAGRPVLIVPDAGRFESLGRRAVVAWNGSREATRAAHDALPILREAEEVIVLSVNPPDTRTRIPGADISVHLARHGVKARAQHAVAPDLGVGDVLLNVIADQNADLLVMGAYGRPRMRELVFGGASRRVLRHMTVPVLMSH